MLMYNHGRTRTGLTNVRPNFERRKRRCTCGEAVRLPEGDKRLRAARPSWSVVCSDKKGKEKTK